MLTLGVAFGILESADAHGPGHTYACFMPLDRVFDLGATSACARFSTGLVFGADETPAFVFLLDSTESSSTGRTAHCAVAA
jgi:hypothetical protein